MDKHIIPFFLTPSDLFRPHGALIMKEILIQQNEEIRQMLFYNRTTFDPDTLQIIHFQLEQNTKFLGIFHQIARN